MKLDRRFLPEYLIARTPAPTSLPVGMGGTRHRPGSVTDEQQALVDHVIANHGGHGLWIARDGSMHLTRPGKDARAGTSASVITGEQGDAILTVFSSSWPDIGPTGSEPWCSWRLDGDQLVPAHLDPLNGVTMVATNRTTNVPAAAADSSTTLLTNANNAAPDVITFRSPPRPLVIPPIEWLAKALWARRTHGELAGPEKSLKSYLGMIIDVGLAAGLPVLGRFDVPEPVRVLQLVGEGGEQSHLRRFKRVCEAYGVDVDEIGERLRYSVQTAPAHTPRFIDGVQAELERWAPALVHIDPWYAYHSASVDSRNLYEQGAALERVGALARDGGAALMINNHFNQTGPGDGLTRITGAGHAEWVDSWMLVAHRERPDVAAGRFRLRLAVGSRQWGGAVWDVDLHVGRFNEITGDHEGTITWTVEGSTGGGVDEQERHDQHIAAAEVALLRVARHKRAPFERSKLVAQTTGRDSVKRAAFDRLVERGALVHVDDKTVAAGTGKRSVERYEVAPGA